MRRNPPRQLPLVALLLICFQGQLLASVLLPCLHGGGIASHGLVEHCHQASNPAPQPATAEHFDCQKCVLAAVLAVYDLPLPTAGLPGFTAAAPRPAMAKTHFYRFSPRQLHRPPIAASM